MSREDGTWRLRLRSERVVEIFALRVSFRQPWTVSMDKHVLKHVRVRLRAYTSRMKYDSRTDN